MMTTRKRTDYNHCATAFAQQGATTLEPGLVSDLSLTPPLSGTFPFPRRYPLLILWDHNAVDNCQKHWRYSYLLISLNKPFGRGQTARPLIHTPLIYSPTLPHIYIYIQSQPCEDDQQHSGLRKTKNKRTWYGTCLEWFLGSYSRNSVSIFI